MLEKIHDINKMNHQKKIHAHKIDIYQLIFGHKKTSTTGWFLI
ncbi:conserved hypothetical protein [Vibrio chagasii]|nr:conserved hypothetical protein [Vibrio chagasii]CAH6918492.1 conserved hypothetical protein [Vibrio chagasii]CAH6928020.1 conserved hypothetical protein [Vibrio chagasii]CAH6950157.1 conserved hypothetical protein [Vibrio chagasii]CAH7054085.1 conserved hypothetical protein [Vibrio chagasii]